MLLTAAAVLAVNDIAGIIAGSLFRPIVLISDGTISIIINDIING